MLCLDPQLIQSDSRVEVNDDSSDIPYFDPYTELYKNPLWIFFWSAVFIMVQILGMNSIQLILSLLNTQCDQH